MHAAEGEWLGGREMWSSDRLHPGEQGHRQLAVRFHALLTEAGVTGGAGPSAAPEQPAPTRSANLRRLGTAGTGWVARRCTDLLPQLLRLAAQEVRHRARGTSARLDLGASHAVAAALGALSVAEHRARTGGGVGAAQRRRTGTNLTWVPGAAWAAAGRSAVRTTAITG